jgi:hypothetical protein
MAEGRLRAEWAQTASLMAQFFNANRDPDKVAAATPEDFSPYGAYGQKGQKGQKRKPGQWMQGLMQYKEMFKSMGKGKDKEKKTSAAKG